MHLINVLTENKKEVFFRKTEIRTKEKLTIKHLDKGNKGIRNIILSFLTPITL